MIKVTLPDGSIREFEQGASALDVAKNISEGLARNVLAAKVNGKVILELWGYQRGCRYHFTRLS
jgi:(p)ppGpp synthase/HD superfamily hydrolase